MVPKPEPDPRYMQFRELIDTHFPTHHVFLQSQAYSGPRVVWIEINHPHGTGLGHVEIRRPGDEWDRLYLPRPTGPYEFDLFAKGWCPLVFEVRLAEMAGAAKALAGAYEALSGEAVKIHRHL